MHSILKLTNNFEVLFQGMRWQFLISGLTIIPILLFMFKLRTLLLYAICEILFSFFVGLAALSKLDTTTDPTPLLIAMLSAMYFGARGRTPTTLFRSGKLPKRNDTVIPRLYSYRRCPRLNT
jgi:hypothetical protein